MLENIATIIVTSLSGVLFLFWFRYVCALILAAKPTRDYARGIAVANELSFPEVQEALRSNTAFDPEILHEALNRDFRIISYLVKNTGSRRDDVIEWELLRVDYWMMSSWC